jgi:hypothetical protein
MTTLLKRYNLNNLLSFFIFLLTILSNTVSAQGNLQIMPKRIVFEGTKRFQELNLANTGQDTAQYVISFINYKMNENGEFQEITSPENGQNFADKYLRIFPRTVKLGPNEAQTIKVQVIKTSSLVAGEYRSHLYFRAVPKLVALGDNEAKPVDDKGISIKLTPVFGLSIPAIIRVGESNAEVTLSDIALDTIKSVSKLKITFNRTGKSSAYGDLVITHTSAEGIKRQVGIARGIAIYTPNSKRHFTLDLDQHKDVNYRQGKLDISFSTIRDAQTVPLADASLALK